MKRLSCTTYEVWEELGNQLKVSDQESQESPVGWDTQPSLFSMNRISLVSLSWEQTLNKAFRISENGSFDSEDIYISKDRVIF